MHLLPLTKMVPIDEFRTIALIAQDCKGLITLYSLDPNPIILGQRLSDRHLDHSYGQSLIPRPASVQPTGQFAVSHVRHSYPAPVKNQGNQQWKTLLEIRHEYAAAKSL